MLAFYAVDWGSIPGRVIQKTLKMVRAVSLPSIQHWEMLWIEHTLLPDGQPPTAEFNVLAQLCDPKAKRRRAPPHLTKNGEGNNFVFDSTLRI